MKELYISPELEILCFAPVEKLSNLGDTWNWARNTSGNDASTGDSYEGDHETPVPTGEEL